MIEWLNDNEGVATWVSGIATMFAVIVSLYLARKQNASKVRVSAELMWYADENISGEYIVVSMTNVGFRDVQVTNFFWKPGIFHKGYLLQLPVSPPGQLSKHLTPSQSESFILPVDTFIAGVTEAVGKTRNRLRVAIISRTFKIIVILSTGEKFSRAVGERLRTRIQNALLS